MKKNQARSIIKTLPVLIFFAVSSACVSETKVSSKIADGPPEQVLTRSPAFENSKMFFDEDLNKKTKFSDQNVFTWIGQEYPRFRIAARLSTDHLLEGSLAKARAQKECENLGWDLPSAYLTCSDVDSIAPIKVPVSYLTSENGGVTIEVSKVGCFAGHFALNVTSTSQLKSCRVAYDMYFVDGTEVKIHFDSVAVDSISAEKSENGTSVFNGKAVLFQVRPSH